MHPEFGFARAKRRRQAASRSHADAARQPESARVRRLVRGCRIPPAARFRDARVRRLVPMFAAQSPGSHRAEKELRISKWFACITSAAKHSGSRSNLLRYLHAQRARIRAAVIVDRTHGEIAG